MSLKSLTGAEFKLTEHGLVARSAKDGSLIILLSTADLEELLKQRVIDKVLKQS